jgi:hypothetical protein
MKTFNLREITTIKRTAMNVNPLVTRKNKIKEKINQLNKEYNELQELQDTWELAIKTLTGGYTTEDLVEKVVEDTGKVDKEGKPIKVTKYVLKYPETVIPVEQEFRGVSPEEIEDVEVEMQEITNQE